MNRGDSQSTSSRTRGTDQAELWCLITRDEGPDGAWAQDPSTGRGARLASGISAAS